MIDFEILKDGLWRDLRACEILWSARETALVVLSAERERNIENVFQMLLTSRHQ